MNTAAPPTLLARLWGLGDRVMRFLVFLHSPAQVAARVYAGSVFFHSGLTKLHDWGTTLALFHDEYHVPLLDPSVAAWLCTGGELVLPVLLVLGLFGRFAAAGLSVVNVVAVLSLSEIAPAALTGHLFWGSLLAFTVLWGPGNWSADRFLVPRLRARVFGAAAGGAGRYAAPAIRPRT